MPYILITAIPTPFPLDTLNTSSSSLWPLPPLLLLLPLISLVLPAHSRVPYEGPHLYRKMAPSLQQPSNTDSSSARGGASWASPPSTLGSPIRLAWSCAGNAVQARRCRSHSMSRRQHLLALPNILWLCHAFCCLLLYTSWGL